MIDPAGKLFNQSILVLLEQIHASGSVAVGNEDTEVYLAISNNFPPHHLLYQGGPGGY